MRRLGFQETKKNVEAFFVLIKQKFIILVKYL